MARAKELQCTVQEREEHLRNGLMGMPVEILYKIVEIVQQIHNFGGVALASTCTFFYCRLGGLEGSRRQHAQYIEA